MTVPHCISKVMQQYENHVKPAYDSYIAPTMQHADIIVPRGGENEVGIQTPYSPNSGLLPSPCFPIFLARTTFVLESLLEAKNPGQDAFWGNFVFNSSYSWDYSLLDYRLYCNGGRTSLIQHSESGKHKKIADGKKGRVTGQPRVGVGFIMTFLFCPES